MKERALMDGFERRKAQSRDDIRRAAAELFSRYGIEKVSMVDVARQAGVSPATIYNNFGSKEVLVQDFVRSRIEALAAEARRAVAGAAGFAEKLEVLFRFVAESFERQGGRAGEDGLPVLDLSLLRDPELEKVKDLTRRGMVELFVEVAREGRASGELDPGSSEEAVALYLSAFLDTFTGRDFLDAYRRRPALLRELRDLVLRGLGRR